MYWVQVDYDENNKVTYQHFDAVPCTKEMVPGAYNSNLTLLLCPPSDKLSFLNSKQ